MTDIDFDELDRAVNSLMNKQQAAKAPVEPKSEPAVVSQAEPDHSVSTAGTSLTPPVTPASPVAPVPSPSPTPVFAAPIDQSKPEPDSQPVVDSQPTVAPPVSAAEPAPAVNRTPGLSAKEVKASPAITRRPTGRFMDVVRPSSAAVAQKPVAPAPSRTGVSIQPSADLVDVVNVGGKNSVDQDNLRDLGGQSDGPDAAPDLKDIEQSESTFAAIENAPIEELAENAAIEEPSLTDKIAQSLATSNEESAVLAPTPLESPFIANVEVEKRPLGAVNQAVVNSGLDDEALAPTEPAEMKLEHQQTDLADYTMDKEALSDAPDSLVNLNPEIVAIEEAGIPESPELDKEPTTTNSVNMPPAGDIPRQYAPENESTEPEPAPMFAAVSTEVKPSADKEKKKSGALTALLIILFLAIGVAGGAAAYFLLIK